MIAALLSILLVADVLCAESGHDWRDAELVAAVVRHRHLESGRSLARVVTRPRQFAAGCAARGLGDRLHWRHIEVAARAHAGRLDTPAWMTEDVWYFCSVPRGGCARWRWLDRLQLAGESPSGHAYWRLGGLPKSD